MKRRVILCPNPTKDDRLETSRRAKAILEEAGFEVCICPEFVDGRPDDLPGDLPLCELEDVIDGAALVVSLGGDGTIMHTVRRMMGHEIPIIGVNLGTVGFLAELDRSDLPMLIPAARGEYTPSPRMMLEISVERGGETVYSNYALNDLSMHGIVQMIPWEQLGFTISGVAEDGQDILDMIGRTEPDVLILDEPTRGIDVGAKAEIQRLMLEMCKDGVSVVFNSSELDEIIRCSNRIIVMRDREKVAELEGENCTQEKILTIIAEGAAAAGGEAQ